MNNDEVETDDVIINFEWIIPKKDLKIAIEKLNNIANPEFPNCSWSITHKPVTIPSWLYIKFFNEDVNNYPKIGGDLKN